MSDCWKVTACPYDCPCTCSMKARHKDGHIEIVRNPDNPWTSFICGKGLRFRERVFDSRRITEPLLRDGAGWKAISWNEAFDIWAKNVSSAVREYGPLSIMYFAGAGSMYFSKELIKNVFAELGGYTSTKGSLCSSIGSFGLKASTCGFGVPFITPEQMSFSKGVLLWGRNVYCTQPQMVRQLNSIRSNGGSVASVEVRNSVTCRHSDLYLRILPGSDWALAAYLCKRFISEGGASLSWQDRVVNYSDFIAVLNELQCENLLETCGISYAEANSLFNWMKEKCPVTHIPAYGTQRYLHGNLQFSWIFALSVICGGFENPCAGLSFSKDEHALFPESLMNSCGNIRKFPAGAWGKYVYDSESPVRVLNIANANPAQQNPQSSSIAEAMSKIPFKVCSDMFMTDTAKLCDLFLPVTTFLEDDCDWIGSYWHSYIVRSERVIPPVGNAKSDIEIYDGLARALGLKTDIMSMYREMDKLMMSDNRLIKVGEGIYRWNEDVYWCKEESRASLPVEVPAPHVSCEGALRLISVHTDSYINGQSLDAPRVQKEPLLHVSNLYAAERGLCDGDLASVTSANGNSVTMRIVCDYGLDIGTAVVDQGTENINILTDAYTAHGGGAPYAECFIDIKKF